MLRFYILYHLRRDNYLTSLNLVSTEHTNLYFNAHLYQDWKSEKLGAYLWYFWKTGSMVQLNSPAKGVNMKYQCWIWQHCLETLHVPSYGHNYWWWHNWPTIFHSHWWGHEFPIKCARTPMGMHGNLYIYIIFLKSWTLTMVK